VRDKERDCEEATVVGWEQAMVTYTMGVSWERSERQSESLTQAKPYICVPPFRVFCTVTQIVALKESIANAEEKSF
jgi:hypothetical protein